MMPWAGCAAAYLVTTYVMSASGALRVEGNTVCFDLALALEMAEADAMVVAGALVFALDRHGAVADPAPIASYGLFERPDQARASRARGAAADVASLSRLS